MDWTARYYIPVLAYRRGIIILWCSGPGSGTSFPRWCILLVSRHGGGRGCAVATSVEHPGKAARETNAKVAPLMADPLPETRSTGAIWSLPWRRLEFSRRSVSRCTGLVELDGIQQEFDGVRVFLHTRRFLEANFGLRRRRRSSVIYVINRKHIRRPLNLTYFNAKWTRT